MDDMRAAVKKTTKLAERQRSSLLSHTFPSFYACYLLKSVQSPTSKATYIGSTPNPPRRIRQHNGELTQGAWKTKRGRPWIMQMIVHGFPSKLAALQFEWAWQHPHLSRHIRDENGKVFTSSGRGLNQNILALRFMISIHPYNLWPLHVKVFTPQALKIWEGLSNVGKTVKGKGKEKANFVQSPALPPGFTYSVELEGVDGKSTGGSGRTKPIEVQDEKFTTAYLKKDLDLLASKNSLECTICQESLTNYTSDPLTHSLCPHPSCNATAHLLCLSKHLLSQNESSSLVPRGGNCPSCSNYVLWGDVVKGCYRRAAGGAVSVEEDEKALGDMYSSDSLEEPLEVTGRKGKGKAKRVVSPRKKRERGQLERSSSSSLGEQFDFQEVEEQQYSDDLGIGTSRRGATRSPSKLKIGQVQLTIPTPLTPSRARKPKATSSSPSTPKKRSKALQARDSSEGELFDFDDVERLSFSDDEGPKRRVGRPRKRLAIEQVVPGPSAQPTGVVKRARSRKDSQRSGPTSPVAMTKRTFIRGATLNDPFVPLKPPKLVIQPLFESDIEDTEMDGPDGLARSMSSLSVTSPSS